MKLLKKAASGPKLLKGLIVLLWLGLMGYWIHSAIQLPPPPHSEDGLLPPSEDYLNIYLNQEKIGWARYSLDRLEDGYQAEQRSVFVLRFGGEGGEEIRTISTAVMNFDFSLRRFNFIMSSGLSVFTARGVVENGRLLVSSRSGVGPQETRDVPLVERLVMPTALQAQIARQGLKMDGRYTARVFDPLTMAAQPITVSVVEEARKNVPESSRPVQAYRLRLDYHGLPIYAWVDKDGRTIEEEGRLGLKLVRVTAEEAPKGIQARPDLIDVIASTSVVAELGETLTEAQKTKLAANPRDLTYLQVGFSGPPLDGFDLDGRNQSWAAGRLAVQAPGRAGLEQQFEPDYSQKDLSRYLLPEPMIEVEDPGLKQLAESLRLQSPRQLDQIAAVINWTEQNLVKRPTMNVPSAAEVLKTGYGDSNEHAVVAVALLRALGLPARPVLGLLYHRGTFFYHAWVEVYLGNDVWLAADPFLGQLTADAGHLRLATGGLEQQSRLISLMGHLKVVIYDLR